MTSRQALDDTPPPEFHYSGRDSLIRMEQAMTNYNRWIVHLFVSNCGSHVRPDTQVLDYGSGIGTLASIFFNRTGVKPDALEIDLVQRLEVERRGFKTFSSLTELCKSYDLIFTSNVLEHIEDDVSVLRALREKLASDGTLLIYVPAFRALWTAMDDKVGHVRRYRKRDMREKLRHCGYTLDKIHYCDSLGFMLTLLFKLFGAKDGDLPIRSLHIYDRFLLPISRRMDVVLSRFFGKNLFVVARPMETPSRAP